MTEHRNDDSILRDVIIHVDGEIKADKLDTLISNRKKKEKKKRHVLIDIAIPVLTQRSGD